MDKQENEYIQEIYLLKSKNDNLQIQKNKIQTIINSIEFFNPDSIHIYQNSPNPYLIYLNNQFLKLSADQYSINNLSIYEISTARGFGSSLSENDLNLGSKLLHWFVSLIGSGPFSTGGGLTLLTIIWIYSLIWKNHKKFQILHNHNP